MWGLSSTLINHYKDPYQTTSIMESKKVFFVAQLTLVSLFIEKVTNNDNALRIQVCPKNGISPKILFWGWDQSYSREGFWILRDRSLNGILHSLTSISRNVTGAFFCQCSLVRSWRVTCLLPLSFCGSLWNALCILCIPFLVASDQCTLHIYINIYAYMYIIYTHMIYIYMYEWYRHNICIYIY